MKATNLEQIAHDCKREEENLKLMMESIVRQQSVGIESTALLHCILLCGTGHD